VHFSQMGQLFRPPVVAAVVATAVFYSAWNLGANTYGQFGTFLWTNLTNSDVQTYSTYTLLGFPLGFLAAYLFMRVADRPARRTWFVVGVVLNVAA
jgi:inositol transporter-like SP family MFS transporter